MADFEHEPLAAAESETRLLRIQYTICGHPVEREIFACALGDNTSEFVAVS